MLEHYIKLLLCIDLIYIKNIVLTFFEFYGIFLSDLDFVKMEPLKSSFKLS